MADIAAKVLPQIPDIVQDSIYTSQAIPRCTMSPEGYNTLGQWGNVARFFAFALIFFTQHHRFHSVKQKSYILSSISSGVMSVFSLYFVGIWAMRMSGASQGEGGASSLMSCWKATLKALPSMGLSFSELI